MKFMLLLIFSFSLLTGFAQTDIRKDSITAKFEYNRAEIINAEELLEQLSKLEISKLSSVRLVGYTDSTGSLARNQTLAAERIRSVELLLSRTSLRKVLTETENANETSGFRTAPDELNRRVDVLFYVKTDPPKSTSGFELNTLVNLEINFRGGTDEFLTFSYQNLDKLKHFMLKDTTLLLKLNGHVCCADDQPLSDKRAKAVMTYLSRNGVDMKRMTAEGFSNRKPLAPDISEANKASNRRVEAFFYRKE